MSFRKSASPAGAGFTLIELLVVIAILATLVGLGAMAVTRTLSGAEDTQRASFAPIVQSAVAAYKSENGEYPLPDGFSVSQDTVTAEFGRVRNGRVERPNAPVLLKLFGRDSSGRRDTSMRAYIADTSDLYVLSASGRLRQFDEAVAQGGVSQTDNIGYRLRMDETDAAAFRDVSGRMAFAPVVITLDFDLERVSVTVPGRTNYDRVLRIGR